MFIIQGQTVGQVSAANQSSSIILSIPDAVCDQGGKYDGSGRVDRRGDLILSQRRTPILHSDGRSGTSPSSISSAFCFLNLLSNKEQHPTDVVYSNKSYIIYQTGCSDCRPFRE